MSDVIPRERPVDLDIRREPLPASEPLRAAGLQDTAAGPKPPPRPRSLIHLAVLAGPEPILKLKTHVLFLQKISAYLDDPQAAP